MSRLNRAARGLSIRQRLTLIVLAVAIPLLALSAAIVWRLDQRERQTRRDAIMYASRSILSAVDAQLDKYIAAAQALARSPTLERDDLAAFRDGPSVPCPACPDPGWCSPMRVDSSWSTPWCQPENLFRVTPRRGWPTKSARSKPSRCRSRTWSSGRSRKSRSSQWGYPSSTPSEPAYYLMIVVDVGVFRDLLNSQHIPDGWLAGVIDRRGNFIARSLDHEHWVGKPASPGLARSDEPGRVV